MENNLENLEFFLFKFSHRDAPVSKTTKLMTTYFKVMTNFLFIKATTDNLQEVRETRKQIILQKKRTRARKCENLYTFRDSFYFLVYPAGLTRHSI